MQPFLDDLALEAAERYLRRGGDLSEIIAEIAERNELTHEQIKRVIERANRAVFLKLFENKVFEFPIATMERVLAYLTGRIEEPIGVVETEDEDVWIFEEPPVLDIELPKEETQQDTAEKYRVVVVALTRMKKAASELKYRSFSLREQFEELKKLLKPLLDKIPPSVLKKKLKPHFESSEWAEVEMILDEVIASLAKTEKKAQKRGDALKVAVYIVKVAGRRSTYIDVARLMESENVSPSMVKEALHKHYHTTIYDHIVDLAMQYKNAFYPDKEEPVDVQPVVHLLKNAAATLEEVGQLMEELELYRQVAEEAAVTDELKNMVARQWSTLMRR